MFKSYWSVHVTERIKLWLDILGHSTNQICVPVHIHFRSWELAFPQDTTAPEIYVVLIGHRVLSVITSPHFLMLHIVLATPRSKSWVFARAPLSLW